MAAEHSSILCGFNQDLFTQVAVLAEINFSQRFTSDVQLVKFFKSG